MVSAINIEQVTFNYRQPILPRQSVRFRDPDGIDPVRVVTKS